MTTIYDIAKRCGVSPSTVSRALGSAQLVKDKTKAEILKIANEMDYVPDSTAKNLKTKKSWNVGVIMYMSNKTGLNHYLFAEIINSFANVMENCGYDITLFSSSSLNDNKSLLAHCKSRRLDGVFIVCGDFNSEPIRELVSGNIPLVTVDYVDAGETSVSCVTSDNRIKMFELTDYIISKGHREIVFVAGSDIYVTNERIKGFKAALKANDITLGNDMLCRCDYYNIEMAQKTVSNILDRTIRPTVIIMPDDYCCIGAYDTLRERGLSVPDDISIAGFDGLEIGQKISPKLTTIRQDTLRMGESAAQKLLGIIDKKTDANFLQIVSAQLLTGSSIKNLNI